MDSKGKHIILQHIHLVPSKAGHITTQIPENTFVGKTLCNHFKSSTNIFYKWIHQNGVLLIQEIRNPGFLEYLRCNTFVRLQISGNHSDFSVFQIFFTDQTAYSPGCLFQFFYRGFCCKYADFFLFLLIDRSSVAKKMLLQKVKRGGISKAALSLILQKNGIIQIAGQTGQCVDHFPAHIE